MQTFKAKAASTILAFRMSFNAIFKHDKKLLNEENEGGEVLVRVSSGTEILFPDNNAVVEAKNLVVWKRKEKNPQKQQARC